MSEPQTAAVTSKAKSKSATPLASVFEMPKFEMPKFEMPSFEMPKMEVPAAFRELAEKSVAQAKEGYEKMKTAAEDGASCQGDLRLRADVPALAPGVAERDHRLTRW